MTTPSEISGPMDRLIDHTVARIKANRAKHAMVGPIVRDSADAQYFILVTGSEERGARIDTMRAYSRADVEMLRGSVVMALVEMGAIVIHDFDDELHMAKWGEALWPARFASIRASVEAERAQWAKD